MLRAYLIDDEELALKRLSRMLKETGRVDIVGESTDPVAALERFEGDVLFLDIEMPGMNGFEFLRALGKEPLVVFTTAYSQYALQAFEVNSVDYLLKPVEPRHLERALNKLDRLHTGAEPRPDLHEILRRLTSTYPDRLPSRTGERVEFVDLATVSHIYAKDKLTFAATATKDYCIDQTIAELEQKLDPKKFLRIHRSTMVNVDFVQELYTWFGGRMLLKLKSDKKRELQVARDRVKALKERLGL
ncbi:MAG TPA: LytTR family DNA-binding domain-containing protein [Bryobacteraceae bacterium]|nr:LytTR family DNA-binding domain-containing protein [Bryobacteraceae bacterium]